MSNSTASSWVKVVEDRKLHLMQRLDSSKQKYSNVTELFVGES